MNELRVMNEYLHTVKLVCDPGRVLDFEQSVQVPCNVVQLDLKTFVAKRHFTVQKQNTRIEEMGQNSGAKKKKHSQLLHI